VSKAKACGPKSPLVPASVPVVTLSSVEIPMEVCDSEIVVITDVVPLVPNLLETTADALVHLFAFHPSMSWDELLALVEAKASAKGVAIPIARKPLSFSTVARREATVQAGISFSDAAKNASTPQGAWSQVRAKRNHSAHKADKFSPKKWAERSASQKRATVVETGRLELPDLKVVHVRGFKVSPDNPVTVLRDLIREEFHFDTSSIWNLSGRAYTQIVELVVVKAQVPALLAAFVDNKLGLQISTGYDPRRPDKVETEAVALGNFKTRVDREISRINRALAHNHYMATVSKLRHVVNP
jgi:hypothetical protein